MRGNHLIKECRRRAGLTQAQLADQIGTTQPAIARLERGVGNPSLRRLSDIAYACGLEIQVSVVPVDPDEWDMVQDNLRLPPAERVAKAVGAAQMALAFRAAGERARSIADA